MSDELVPEMHDIGKLVDWDSIREIIAKKSGIDKSNLRQIQIHSHSFVFWDKKLQEISYLKSFFGVDEPEGSTWKVINYHHDEEISKGDVDIFLIRLADGMASSVSRVMREEGEERKRIKDIVKGYEKRSVYQLWYPEKIPDLDFISITKFPDLIKFINKNPVGKDFLEDEEYKKLLLRRPEDFMRSNDITSLYIHSKLVGKFYRFFKERINVEAPDRIVFSGRMANSPDNAESQWNIKLVKCSVKLTQNPVRGSDLNIFERLKEIMHSITERDNVLFSTSTGFLAMLLPNENIDEVIKPLLDTGFYLEIEGAHTTLGDAYPTPKSIKERGYKDIQKNIAKIDSNIDIPLERKEELKKRIYDEFQSKFIEKLAYPDLESKIDIPICESCQMGKGTKEWPKDSDKLIEEALTETLCEKCFGIRSLESRLPMIKEWSYSEENPRVVWVKISIEIDELEKVLRGLYLQYLKDLRIPDPEKYTDIRFSVFSEFQRDYDEFLGEVGNALTNSFGDKNVQTILDDFFCIKLEKTSDIKRILDIYKKHFEDYFPKFKGDKSPIKLSISCSNIKFAFFWHWRFLENPEKDINVNMVGKGEMHLSLKQLDNLPELEDLSMSKLHKLAKISETYKRLAKILLHHKDEWRFVKREDYEKLKEFTSAVGFDNVLTYAKMMRDKDEVH